MTRVTILFTALFLIAGCTDKIEQKEPEPDFYFVHGETAEIFDTTSTYANVQDTLEVHSNIELIDILDDEWYKVKYRANFKEKIGFGRASSFTPGKAVELIVSERVGAICNDGTETDKSGNESCADQGGVKEWITELNSSIRIQHPELD